MIIAAASDHAGFELKRKIVDRFSKSGYEVRDLGPYDDKSVDYPDFAYKVSRAIEEGEADRGVLICGSGIGMSIAANRNRAVNAALVHDVALAKLARTHNDANVIVFGARFIEEDEAIAALDVFLTADFEGGRHRRRTEKAKSPGEAPM